MRIVKSHKLREDVYSSSSPVDDSTTGRNQLALRNSNDNFIHVHCNFSSGECLLLTGYWIDKQDMHYLLHMECLQTGLTVVHTADVGFYKWTHSGGCGIYIWQYFFQTCDGSPGSLYGAIRLKPKGLFQSLDNHMCLICQTFLSMM